MQRALRVGITGKMGSGKSTLSQVLREKGAIVIETDALAKQLMEESPAIKSELLRLFGDDAFSEGHLNRSYLAKQIFSDASKRIALESIVHPAVTDELERVFESTPAGQIVAAESALIFQTNLWQHFDYIVLVNASDDVVLDRASASGRFTREDVATRLVEQGFKDTWKSDADFTLENNGSVDELRSRASVITLILFAAAKRDLPDVPIQLLEPQP